MAPSDIMYSDAPSVEDEREVELSTIAAIFPELVLDNEDPFSASIDLPVTPSSPIPVIFPESSDGAPAALDATRVTASRPLAEIHLINHFPPVNLRISLPQGYPALHPPKFTLSTSPQWLAERAVQKLQDDGKSLWEDFGHDQVVYAYLDHIQQAADSAFDALESADHLVIPQEHQIAILDYDMKAKKAAFEKETFDCGICLDPKKGSACHRMLDCGHVFCCECLQNFYNNAITEGDLVSVRCLTPDCTKKREQLSKGSGRRSRTTLSPSELLQIPLGPDMVKRYVTLKHKAELESDKNTVYCPRKWCQGAARSKKHRKPTSFAEDTESDEGSEDEQPFSKTKELLCVCEDCSFAFCSRCFQGWHGEFTLCIPRTNTGELTEEDKASLEYLKLHTTPCPTCAAPAQKTHGCNHMICFRCNTHFCYLCSAWLDAGNPYRHFNVETTGCFQRLWELEGGDGDDVGIGYGGGRDLPVDEIVVEEDVADEHVPLPAAPEPPVPAGQLFAREGPLVLRLGHVPVRPEPVPAIAPAAAGGRGWGRGRGRRGRGRGARGMMEEPQDARAQAAQQAWVQNFVMMALNDEEDLLEDGDGDDRAWEIPVR